MAEAIAVRKYTRKEAEDATQAFITTGCKMRQMLLDIYEREAHTALGYPTFEEYTKDRLGAEWKDDYLRQLRLWAKVEREVLYMYNNGQPTKSLPYHQASQLSRLPSYQRKAAYDECVELCEHGKVYRPQSFLTNLTHIVNRRLKAIAPPPTEQTEPTTTTNPQQATTPSSQTHTQEQTTTTTTTTESTEEETDLFAGEEVSPVIFARWRANFQKAWNCLEAEEVDLNPDECKEIAADLCAVKDWLATYH